MITDCPHGMPSPKSCFSCMEDGPVEPPPRPEPARVILGPFTARYQGKACAGCGFGVEPGERIALWSDQAYRHDRARCAP